MRTLSLFSGVGGFDLGAERAGMEIVAQCEIDPFCRAVLAKHWPGVPCFEDVRTLTADQVGPVDCIIGGVPCQPASCAGKRKGSADERWLWGEWVRLVRECRPAWFIAENVRGFLSLRESRMVIGDLEGAGYEVRTLLLGAHHVGAPHRRDRVWIVGRLADAASWEREMERESAGGRRRTGAASHAKCTRPRWPARVGQPQHAWEEPRLVNTKHCNTNRGCTAGLEGKKRLAAGPDAGTVVGLDKPRVGIAVDGLPRRLAGLARRSSLRALGNAVVPQVAEVVCRAVMEAHAAAKPDGKETAWLDAALRAVGHDTETYRRKA